MSLLGINVAGRAEYSPADIAGLGARWARCVAYPGVDIRSWIQGCHDRGVKVLLVLASESIGQAPNGWGPKIADFADRYGTLVDAWQVGNESDHVSPSSWTMSYEDLNRMLKTARTALGASAYLVGPGMASGDPNWLRGVDLRPVDAIAVHPYAKDPGTAQLRDMLDGYLAYGKPLWITEYHAHTLGMAAYLKVQQSIQVALAFCYSDQMVKGFGMIEDPRALADFKASALHQEQPPVISPPPKSYVVGPGILKRMEQYGTTPATDEDYRPSSSNWTYSEAFGINGQRFVYLRATKEVLVFDLDSRITDEELFNPKPKPQGALQWFTAQQIARTLGAPQGNVNTYWPAVAAALDEQGIGDRSTTIAALATIGVEVGSFAPINEFGDDAYFERNYGPGTSAGAQLGNVNPGDGARYHGRGFIQLTGRSNYRRYGQRLGVDLEGNPDLALEASTAARVLAMYFQDHGVQALAGKPDWAGVRQAVNGGMNGWQRFADFVDALVAIR